MFEVTGRAIDSFLKEVFQMKEQLQRWGSEINHRLNILGYGCVRNGFPGSMGVTDNASYSVWCHEFDYIKKAQDA